MTKKNIVIVGGFGGALLARALSIKLDKSKHNLVLIDRRPTRTFMIAAARMVVSDAGDLEHNANLPFDRIFSKGIGEFKQGTVTAIEKTGTAGGHVVLESGEREPFDVLVLATGSIWSGAIALPSQPDEISAFLRDTRAKIKNAKDIVLVGGGAVGLELAGEIKDIYPKTNVTIVHGGEALLNDTYPLKFRKAVEKGVTARGIKVVLNEFVDDIPTDWAASSVKTRSGKTINADLVLPTTGPRPNTGFIISSLGESVANSNGYITVKPTFQLPAHAEIFAIGDIADLKEQKQAGKIPGHADIVAANILAYLNNSPHLKEYKGGIEGIFVTNGKDGGRGYMPFFGGINVGDFLVRNIKSKNLLIGMYKGQTGY